MARRDGDGNELIDSMILDQYEQLSPDSATALLEALNIRDLPFWLSRTRSHNKRREVIIALRVAIRNESKPWPPDSNEFKRQFRDLSSRVKYTLDVLNNSES